MAVKLPFAFETPLPGQFIMLRIKGKSEPFLGRPLSVYAFQRRREKVICEVLYRVVGKGTQQFSLLKFGSTVEVLGPLGRSFTIFPSEKDVILIAGGMGIAPMTYVAGHYRGSKAGSKMKMICYTGARSMDDLVALERMEVLCKTKVSTDDGSRGYHGMVTDLFKNDFPTLNIKKTVIYACGPRPMLKALAAILEDQPVICEVSLEERMACGVGVCLGCVTAIKDDRGNKQYKRVCKEGPVFNIKDIMWD
ncbi:MAG: dihydroorotate dehydrogenase electron transfer subunit [Deltaproteobacteria bacterium]|nr:dihydroorotate dehydrogenase electron transfer subunit [Deltaproteobacteria bacterium]